MEQDVLEKNKVISKRKEKIENDAEEGGKV